MAAPAGDQRAADHHHGDRGQQIFVAHAEARLAGKAGEQHADERRAEAATACRRRSRVRPTATPGERAPPARRCRPHRPAARKAVRVEQNGRADDEQRATKRTTGVSQPVWPVMNQRSSGEAKPAGVPLRVDQRDALQDAVHRQRHDDRREAEHDDADAVDEADAARPMQQHQRQGIEQRVRRSPATMPASRMPQSAIVQGSERSRPPVRITVPWPSARMARKDRQHEQRVEVGPARAAHGRGPVR